MGVVEVGVGALDSGLCAAVGVEAALTPLIKLAGECSVGAGDGDSGFLGEGIALIFSGGSRTPAALDDMTDVILSFPFPWFGLFSFSPSARRRQQCDLGLLLAVGCSDWMLGTPGDCSPKP